MAIVGLDLGHPAVAEAEHWLAQLPPIPDLVACTHLVYGPRPRVVITLATPGILDPARIPVGLALPGTAVQHPAADRAVADHAATDHAATDRAAADRAAADHAAADRAVADHAAGRAGRAVIYPGVGALVGLVTVVDVLAKTAIQQIRVLGAAEPEPAPDALLDTRGYVRPQWVDGQLTLIATPAPGGRIAPFEVPDPTPCCGDRS